jgi:hypothetical protein
MSLFDFWAQLDYPIDSPHVIQGRGNNITPEEYYTQENYDNIYNMHVDWLKKEIKYILDNQ